MRRKHLIIAHLAFWFIVLSINYSFLIFGNSKASINSYLSYLDKSLLEAGVFYIYYFKIAPRLFRYKKYLRFSLITLCFLLIYIPFYAIIHNYVIALLNKSVFSWDTMNNRIIVATYYSVLYVILGGLSRLAIEGYRNNLQKTEIEKQSIKNELAFLRTQINPHFLFNTLNTIHSFIISGNPNSSKAVIKLSDIMRYMLYDASREEITLNSEIEYLQSFLTLQDLRRDKEKSALLNITGESDGKKIPPMLLIPFVENAYKHGKHENSKSGIEINIDIEEKWLVFEVKNTIRRTTDIEEQNNEGVGLKNVKRRLDLLFPENYSLDITESNNKYRVFLKIRII